MRYGAWAVVLRPRKVVGVEDGVKVGVVPASVAPDSLAGDPFVGVAAFFVHPAHRGMDRVPFDPMEAELFENEPGTDADRVGGVSASPRPALSEHDSADGAPRPPGDLVQSDEPDVAELVGHDRPVQLVLALGADAL